MKKYKELTIKRRGDIVSTGLPLLNPEEDLHMIEHSAVTDRDEIISMLEGALIEAGKHHQGMRSVPGNTIKEALDKLTEWKKDNK